jgi:hypothetical protein
MHVVYASCSMPILAGFEEPGQLMVERTRQLEGLASSPKATLLGSCCTIATLPACNTVSSRAIVIV